MSRVRTPAFFLSVLTFVSQPYLIAQESPGGGGRPSRQTLLDEAFESARSSKYIQNSVAGLVAVAEIFQNDFPEKAGQSMEEGLLLLPRIREAPAPVALMPAVGLESAGQTLRLQHALESGIPFHVAFLREVSALAPKSAEARRAFEAERRSQIWYGKDGLALRLVKLLARKDPPRALQTALTIQAPAIRAIALEAALGAWGDADTDATLSSIRILAGRPPKESTVIDLATLSRLAAKLDPALGRELARASLARLSAHTNPAESEHAYAAIAALEPTLLEEVVTSATNARQTNPSSVLALARGLAARRPDLAWRAIGSIATTDESDLPEIAATVREISANTTTDSRERARDCILRLLTAVPQHEPTLGTLGNVRKELRKMGTVSDLMVGLAQIDPTVALERIVSAQFSRNVAFWFLDQRGFLGKTWSGRR